MDLLLFTDTQLGSEVTVSSLNTGGRGMDLLLFIDTQLGSGDEDLCLFLLLEILRKHRKMILALVLPAVLFIINTIHGAEHQIAI